MPVIESSNTSIIPSKGVHLYHTDISNCCDRVRIALEEKGIEWESHFYVLPRGDHLTEEFFALNPKGVVPVLVHDGVVITESNDIISYLDDHFPQPPLQPDDPDKKKRMHDWMQSAADYHVYIAALSFEFLFKATPYEPTFFQRRAKFRANVPDPMKVIFDPRNHAVKPDAVKEGIREANRIFADMNATLDRSGPWLLGEQITLADISWAVQIHRLKTLNMRDIENYPHVASWYARLEERESVKKGMLQWETKEPYALFNQYVEQRVEEGTDVNASCWRE